MATIAINFLLDLWNSLQAFAEPVFNFFTTNITIAGESYSVMYLLFGGAIGVFLLYSMLTWLGNLIT